MKRVIFPLAALLLTVLASSFILIGRGPQDIRKLEPFEGIGVGIHADVFYTQGDAYEIRIEGPEKDVNDLITEVRDDFLQLKYENYRIKRAKLTIYITSKELENVKLSGSGHFMVKDPLSADEMDLAISGSGGITFMQLEADEVGVRISGSGNASIEKGVADELDVRISGSGKLLAERFIVDECSVAISGSGDVRVTVEDELGSKISGSGKVYYHGDPRVNSISSGSGKTVAL